MRTISLLLLILASITPASAALKSMPIEYRQGGNTFEGYLVYDDSFSGPRPGVLVVHEWYGLNDYARRRADQLAGLGYAAFAVDMYGKGIVAQSREEAGKLAGGLKGNRELMRARINAAFETFKDQKIVDRNRIAVMGYCFGGTVALELARSGAEVLGTISFHGGLDSPRPLDANNIKGKVLVLHGADDPGVPPDQVAAFEEEMRRAKVDWQLIAYGNTVHAFTNPASGNDNSKGAAYNADSDRRSWEAMKDFFAEIFQEK